MKIAIADDDKAVIDAYSDSINYLGHTPIPLQSVARLMKTISDPRQKIDILILDHHFRGEETGVSKIAEIQRMRPDLDIVVTTKQNLEPNFVQEIVNGGVGFFKKSVLDPHWLTAELAQRVNIRTARINAIQRRLQAFADSPSLSREGFLKLPFLQKGKKNVKTKIVNIARLENQYVFPSFRLFMTVHSGVTKEITEEETWEEVTEIKAATAFEVGLKFSETNKFFGSQIGGEITNKLKSEFSVLNRRTLKGTTRVGQKIEIPVEELKKGIRKKEFYRGILHSVFKVVISVGCSACGNDQEIDLYILCPETPVEVAVAFDQMGQLHHSIDSRLEYPIWGQSEM